MGEAYDALMERMRELDVIGQIGGLLGWDQEVMMPPNTVRFEHHSRIVSRSLHLEPPLRLVLGREFSV